MIILIPGVENKPIIYDIIMITTRRTTITFSRVLHDFVSVHDITSPSPLPYQHVLRSMCNEQLLLLQTYTFSFSKHESRAVSCVADLLFHQISTITS